MKYSLHIMLYIIVCTFLALDVVLSEKLFFRFPFETAKINHHRRKVCMIKPDKLKCLDSSNIDDPEELAKSFSFYKEGSSQRKMAERKRRIMST